MEPEVTYLTARSPRITRRPDPDRRTAPARPRPAARAARPHGAHAIRHPEARSGVCPAARGWPACADSGKEAGPPGGGRARQPPSAERGWQEAERCGDAREKTCLHVLASPEFCLTDFRARYCDTDTTRLHGRAPCAGAKLSLSGEDLCISADQRETGGHVWSFLWDLGVSDVSKHLRPILEVSDPSLVLYLAFSCCFGQLRQRKVLTTVSVKIGQEGGGWAGQELI